MSSPKPLTAKDILESFRAADEVGSYIHHKAYDQVCLDGWFDFEVIAQAINERCGLVAPEHSPNESGEKLDSPRAAPAK